MSCSQIGSIENCRIAVRRPRKAAKITPVSITTTINEMVCAFCATGSKKTFRKRSHEQKITDLHKVETVEDLNVE